MERFGERPRPRILVRGFPPGLAQQLSGAFPTVKLVTSLSDVDQDEYDVLVTPQSAGSSHRLFAIVIGGTGAANVALEGYIPDIGFKKDRTTVSKVLLVPPGIPDAVADLVKAQLVPLVESRPTNFVLDWNISEYHTPEAVSALPLVSELVEPFLLTHKDEILAGRFEKKGGKAECWCLPPMGIDDVAHWVQVAASVWKARAPHIFPTEVAWPQDPAWRSPLEEEAQANVDAHRDERARLLAELDRREEQLTGELKRAIEETEHGVRRLLTAKGEALVAAVETCLTDLGFTPKNMDEEQPKGDKVEDLRVEDPDLPGWVALVEVKGYGKGAKSNDLLAFTKFVARLGRMPEGCWYIVNQHAGQNPAVRPRALHSKEPEVQAFAEHSNGLIIDTSELFQLWKATRTGALPSSEARSILREGKGRFTFGDLSR
jgi:hypothetical protein